MGIGRNRRWKFSLLRNFQYQLLFSHLEGSWLTELSFALLLPHDCLIFKQEPISTKLNCVYYSLNTTRRGKIIPRINRKNKIIDTKLFSEFDGRKYFRRQTAEEREQERQAAAKYFLSMQMSGLDSDSPPSPPPHMIANGNSPSPSPSPGPSPQADQPPQSLNALESLKPWTESK